MAVKMFTTIAVTSLLRDYDDHYDCDSDSDRVYGCENGSNRNDTCDCKSQGAKLWMLQNSKKVGHIFYATLVPYVSNQLKVKFLLQNKFTRKWTINKIFAAIHMS